MIFPFPGSERAVVQHSSLAERAAQASTSNPRHRDRRKASLPCSGDGFPRYKTTCTDLARQVVVAANQAVITSTSPGRPCVPLTSCAFSIRVLPELEMPCDPYYLLCSLTHSDPSIQPAIHPHIPIPIPYPVGAVVRSVFNSHSPVAINRQRRAIIRGHSLARCSASVCARPASTWAE